MRQQARMILTAMMRMIRTTTPEIKQNYLSENKRDFFTVSIPTYGRGCDDFSRCPRRVKPPVKWWSCFPVFVFIGKPYGTILAIKGPPHPSFS
jgi:hypothetical protein